MHRSSNLESVLGRIAWPEEVDGCAFVVERVVVPPDAERDLPSDPDAAVELLLGIPTGRTSGCSPPCCATVSRYA